jgi:hypothetical protein
MSLGPAEIVIVLLLVICLLVVPILLVVGFVMMRRRVERVEQDLKTLQEQQKTGTE